MAAESGRVDLHVHLAGAAGLKDAIAADVAFLRDAGTREGVGLAFRESRNPQVVSAGRALFRQGGYGGRFGIAVGTGEDAKREIHRLKSAGAGIIKVMASGMVSLSQRGTVTPGGFSLAILKLIVAEASALGLAVMAHANGEAAITSCAEACVHSVEHGFFMTDAALDHLHRRGTLWVPTASALKRAAEAANAPAAAREIAAGTIAEHLMMIGRAFKLGVRLGIGTDCTLPDQRYREAYEAELACFRQAGIPADAVERIARESGRELFGSH